MNVSYHDTLNSPIKASDSGCARIATIARTCALSRTPVSFFSQSAAIVAYQQCARKFAKTAGRYRQAPGCVQALGIVVDAQQLAAQVKLCKLAFVWKVEAGGLGGSVLCVLFPCIKAACRSSSARVRLADGAGYKNAGLCALDLLNARVFG